MDKPSVRRVFYTLDKNGNPVEVDDYIQVGELFDDIKKRILKRSQVKCGRVRISTVFLVINHAHSYAENIFPVLWETMIFGGKYSGWCIRYNSREAAKRGHNAAVRLAQGQKPSKIGGEIESYMDGYYV